MEDRPKTILKSQSGIVSFGPNSPTWLPKKHSSQQSVRVRTSLFVSNLGGGQNNQQHINEINALDYWTKHNPLLMAEEIFLDSNVMTWDNTYEFILSIISFSVGLSNMWRFPFMVLTYGGFPFLIAYICVLFLIGIPMVFLEFYIGQFTSRGIGGCWNIAPGFIGIGYAMIIFNIFYSLYYHVLLGWILFYFINTIHIYKKDIPYMNCGNVWNDDYCLAYNEFQKTPFDDPASFQFWYRRLLLNHDKNGSIINEMSFIPGLLTWYNCACMFISYFLCCIVLMNVSQKINESFRIIILAVYILVALIHCQNRRIPFFDRLAGIVYISRKNINHLLNPMIWYRAIEQLFFSFGLGFGNMINLRKHNSFNDNILISLTLTITINFITSILFTIIIFIQIGHIPYQYNITMDELSKMNFDGLMYIAVSESVSQLSPQIIGWAYFLFLFLVNFYSLTYIVDTAITGLVEVFPLLTHTKYHKLCFILIFNVACSICSIIFVTRIGYQWVKLFYIYFTSSNITFIGLLECILFIYVYGINSIKRDYKMMIKHSMPALLGYQLMTVPFFISGFYLLTWIPIFDDNLSMFYNNFPILAKLFGFAIYTLTLTLIPLGLIYVYILFKTQHFTTEKSLLKLFHTDIKWGPIKKSNWLLEDYYLHKLMIIREINQTINRRESLNTVLYQPKWIDKRLLTQSMSDNSVDHRTMSIIREKSIDLILPSSIESLLTDDLKDESKKLYGK